jgi:2-polyprenyl-3-methyl-5-hydroxy-6-metoxy-1,4-benzoquinol methylase
MRYGAPRRNQARAWDRFWASVRRTGPDGEVLWDAASAEEMDGVRARVLADMVTDLPVVDVGCGNGRFSRLLAGSFPQVLGIDISANAVRRAEEESGDVDNVMYRVLDITAADAGKQLFDQLGEANVFTRGVLHLFADGQRERVVANLREMIGHRGVVYCAETNFPGDPLDQLVALGVTPTSIPEPLRKAMAAGVKPPRHIGEAQLDTMFPPQHWETLTSGPITMHAVPLTTKGEFEPIPSFYATVRRRP